MVGAARAGSGCRDQILRPGRQGLSPPLRHLDKAYDVHVCPRARPGALRLRGGAAPAPGLGPGRGPWRAEPAERHGLSTAGLAKAAALVQEMAPERHCFLVVKDGVVVHETYYGNSTPTSRYESDSLGKQGTALLMALGATKVRAPAVLPRMAEPAALG